MAAATAGGGPKGTSTPLGSYFSPENTRKATHRVEEAISGRRQELHRLHSFLSDNCNLVNVVPFGGAAFFPGRLIHTNEFLVLMGDNYYAERSAKQTIETLKRREKALEDQVEALKAAMMDLQAEAKFFKSTADEASEGIVEIREEYIEDLQKNSPRSDNLQRRDKDEEHEHARIMKILSQLEMKELESGSVSGVKTKNKLVPEADENETTSYSTHDNERKVLQKNIEHHKGCEYFGSAGFEKPESSSELHLPDQFSVLESEKHFITEVFFWQHIQPSVWNALRCSESFYRLRYRA